MTEDPQFLKWLKNSRRMIETVIGQLTERFNMEIVRTKKSVSPI